MQEKKETMRTRMWRGIIQGIAWVLLIMQGIPMFGQIQTAVASGVSPFSPTGPKSDVAITLGMCVGAILALILGGFLCWRTKGQNGKLICMVALILVALNFVIR